MGDQEGSEHNLEQVGGQVVVDEQGPVVEEVGNVVEEISSE